MKKYDCIIIGGGLSGSTLGVQLLKQNRSVLIIEKQDIKKREKLCGGLLTKNSYELLKNLINIYDLNITQHTKALFHNEDKAFSLDIEIYTLNRPELDDYMLNLYINMGGEILSKATYTNLDIEKSIITIEGEKYQYKYLISAEGVHSTLRKMITNRSQRKHFALEIKDDQKRDLEIYFSGYFKGYSWIIPNHKHSMIGLGEVTGRDDLLDEFKKYLNVLGIENKDIRGAYLPSGDDFFFNYKNIFFIGDSAGLASSLTGEGIYYALLSAKILSKNLNKNYKKKMRKYLMNLYIAKFYSKFVYSKFWRKVIFEYRDFFLIKIALKIFIKMVL